jgi:hypothetical protein
MGMLAWDFVMSLEPYWFSTLIGPYVFMGGFLGAHHDDGADCDHAPAPARSARLDRAVDAA